MNTFLYFAVLLKNLTNETTFYQQTLSGLLWRLKRSSWEIFDLVSSSLFHFTSLRRHVTAPWNCLIFSLFGKWSPLPLWYRLYSQQKLINLNSRAGSPHLGISVLTRRSFSNSDESPPPSPADEIWWQGRCNVFSEVQEYSSQEESWLAGEFPIRR